jgi:hypothetical protein
MKMKSLAGKAVSVAGFTLAGFGALVWEHFWVLIAGMVVMAWGWMVHLETLEGEDNGR